MHRLHTRPYHQKEQGNEECEHVHMCETLRDADMRFLKTAGMLGWCASTLSPHMIASVLNGVFSPS